MRDSENIEKARCTLGAQLAECRRAAGYSQARLAVAVNWSRSTVANVETGRQHVPPRFWEAADEVLGARGNLIEASDRVEAAARRERQQAARELQAAQLPVGRDVDGQAGSSAGADARELMTWVASTNISDDTVEQIASACRYLAEAHTRLPATKVLSGVLQAHQRAQQCLRTGRQRLRQTRELLRIDSRLLAHACLLLGDLGRNRQAAEYGAAALLFAQEAGTDEAVAWSVQAKTARWRERYVESAEFARRGFEVAALTATKAELAYREANAIALFGDVRRAREALARADATAQSLPAERRSGVSVWSFPAGRQAVFALSVALHTGDPDGALRAAAMADAGWAAGDPKIPATWAQIRGGSAIAYVMKDSLDGAVEQITPVLGLPVGLRIGTVTGYLDKLDQLLAQPRYLDSPAASELRQQIHEFSAAAVPGEPVPAAG